MNMRSIIPWGRSSNQPSRFDNDQQPLLSQHPLLSLHREMNRLFDDVFRGFDMPIASQLTAFGSSWPKLEITETDQDIRIAAEVPGLEDKDIEVLLDDGYLTLRGERTSHTEDKAKQFSEHYYGRFERRIPIDAAIAEDKVTADFKNGLLTVTLPKTEPSSPKSRRIAINGAH